MSLGTNVNYLRRQKKMTQEQLAEQLCVTRQTVSRWETDEVTPELAKLVEMCSLFACSLDALVREDLAAGSKIYSDVTIRSLPSFRLAGYVMISPCPENDVNGYMDRWAGESGLKTAFPAAKRIGWDFSLRYAGTAKPLWPARVRGRLCAPGRLRDEPPRGPLL